jgi:hypothetical protein
VTIRLLRVWFTSYRRQSFWVRKWPIHQTPVCLPVLKDCCAADVTHRFPTSNFQRKESRTELPSSVFSITILQTL